MKIYTINGNTRKPVDGITAGMLRDSLDTDFTLALTLYNSDARRIKKGTVLEYNGNFFDVATRTKYMNGQAPFVDTTANSIFCRLNRAEYALDSFAVNGTPAEIMTAALHGTPFTFGKTDLTGKYTIVVNETSSRRAVLLTIAAQLHGEIEINGYEISLLAHRGSADEIELLDTGVVSDVQEESDDAEGTTSYSITLLHKVNLKAGDNIHLKFDPLEIDAHTRITAIEYNPYNPLEVNIEVGDYEMDIVDSFISASNEIAAAKHEFKVTSEALTSRIESAEGDISSLEQTAESLTSRITSAEGDVSVLQQTAQSLTSRIESAEGDISSLEQTAESLTATVSTKADKTSGAASTFGYTLTSSTFTLNSNGVAVMQVDKNGGKIKNLTIDGVLYFGGNDDYYINANHGDNGYYINLPNFRVDEASGAVFSGTLSAAKGSFSGTITASGGKIGNLTIGDGGLVYGTVTNNVATGVKITTDTVWSKYGYFSSGAIGCWWYGSSGMSGSYNSTAGYNGQDTVYIHPETVGYRLYGFSNQTVCRWQTIVDIINTASSDERVKNSIENLPDSYELLFDALIPRRYKYNEGTSDRYHTGYIAQEVVQALTQAGFTTKDFAAVMLENAGTEAECWKLRRDEFVALNTWQIQKLKARIAELEVKIKA